jgi:peptidoglycan/xylan/chitin deacetylase (PgdA/CDA1 family)
MELGQAAHYGREEFERYSCWNVTKRHDPTLRQGLYRTLCQLLQPLSERERLKTLGQLLGWFGTPAPSRSTHRILSANEVVQLADGGLIEIGSHTVTHPVLASLSPTAGGEEIRQSKVRLEEILAHPVTSFAYPYGGRAHYTKQTVAAVRETGYQRACSNFDGLVRPNSDRWELPRFLVRDWDAEEFACRFRDWLRS